MKMNDFSFYRDMVVDPLSDGLVGIRHMRGRELWSRRKLRKTTKCSSCGIKLDKKSVAYAPLTNREYRGDRLCCGCIEK